MKIRRVFLTISLFSLLSTQLSLAQSSITGSGTAQYVPKFIDASQIGNSILYLSGTDSLGAGTNAPQGRIHSKIGAGLSNFILESDVTAPGSGSSLGQIDWYNGSYGGNVRARIVGMADGAWSSGLYPTRLSFYTNNYGSTLSERLRIDANGFVGIGTSAPTSILHTIASGAKTAAFTGNLLTNTATSSTAGITKYGLDILSTGTWNGSGAKNIGLHVSATGGSANYAAIFDGAVGIGTSTPAHGLDVGLSWITGGDNSNSKRNFLNLSATSSFGAVDIIYPNAGKARFCETGIAGVNDVLLQLMPGSPSGYGYLETWGGAGTIIGTGNSKPIIFRPARTERMRLDSVGNFGIGTSTPKNHLDVTGSMVLGNTYAGTTVAATNALLVEGSIGIGTTTPDTFKLKANGTIKAKEVVVEVNGWPDYVFEDGHELLPLEDLEKEVRATKHLPGIPSAAEIKTRGLHVAEMQVKMMKKIEELTLYVIQLKKDNALLNDRLSKLSH